VHFGLLEEFTFGLVWSRLSQYPTKLDLLSVLKHRERAVLKIQCVVARQWLKLHPPIFTRFTLISYLQGHPFYKNQAAKFPAILDGFYLALTVIGEFQQNWVKGAGGWPVDGFKF